MLDPRAALCSQMAANLGQHLELWVSAMALAGVVAGWNIRALRAVSRRASEIDTLIAGVGAVAIIALVIGASLVITEVSECAFAASSDACAPGQLALLIATDLAICVAAITGWLRSDACRAQLVARRRPTTQHG